MTFNVNFKHTDETIARISMKTSKSHSNINYPNILIMVLLRQTENLLISINQIK